MAQSLDAAGEWGAGLGGGPPGPSPPANGSANRTAAAVPGRSPDGRAPHGLPQQGNKLLHVQEAFVLSHYLAFVRLIYSIYLWCFIRSPPVFRSMKAFYTAPTTGWMRPSRGWVLLAASQQSRTFRVTQTTCRSDTHIKVLLLFSVCGTICLLASWPWKYLLMYYFLYLIFLVFQPGLQLVLDDSERIRSALQDFGPVLDEISAVCDMSSQQEKLQHNDRQVHKMQRKILEPLQHLLEAVGVIKYFCEPNNVLLKLLFFHFSFLVVCFFFLNHITESP